VHVVFSKPTKTYIYQNLSPNILCYFLEALCTLRTMSLEQILHCGVSQDISFFRERDYTRISLRGKEFKIQQQSAQAARSYPEPSRRALSYWIRDPALPPWSTQGRVEKKLGLRTRTERISWQWCGRKFAGGSGGIARSHRRR
jgi:hypothetical protein